MSSVQSLGMPGIIEYLFQSEFRRLRNGETDIFSFSTDWKEVIGQQGVKVIAKKLERALYAKIRIVNKEDRVFMEVIEGKTDHIIEEEKADVKPVDYAKAPRPPNAFILYRQSHHASIQAKYPGFRNTALSKIIGAKWKSEPPTVRKHYGNLAGQLKDMHNSLFPEYSYKPRKAADKKRRMTATKAVHVEALARALVSKDDSTNDNFVSISSKASPVFAEETFGGQKVSTFVIGNPDVSVAEFRNMIDANNEKFSGDSVDAHQRIQSIIMASPASVLDEDIISYQSLPMWTEYNSSAAVDGATMDQEFEDVFQAMPIFPTNTFGGDSEIALQDSITP